MLMEIGLPKMRGLLVMTMASISPSPAESLRRRAKVLLPKFRLETATLRPESPLLIFFLGQNDLYTRRWTPEVGWAEHNSPGHAWGAQHALVSCAHQVAPSGSYLLQYFLYIAKQFSINFQLIWRCAEQVTLTQLFQVQNSSCRHSPSLCKPCIL